MASLTDTGPSGGKSVESRDFSCTKSSVNLSSPSDGLFEPLKRFTV